MKCKLNPIIALIILIALFSSCKKTKNTPTPPPTDSTILAAKAKDSALLDSRDFYLWYSDIPSTFNAQSYNDPNAVMVAIRDYSNEPGFGVVDQWSFGILKTDWNLFSGAIGSVNSVSASGDF